MLSKKKLAREIENGNHFEESLKKAKRERREAELKEQRREGEASALSFQKAFESGKIIYNKKTGKFEDAPKKSKKMN